MPVNAILVSEPEPPTPEDAISWPLLTTLPIQTVEDAKKYVRWHALRWRIERFHYALNSGCQMEDLPLKEASRLQNAIGAYSIIAWRLTWLTYEARVHPKAPATAALTPTEIEALRALDRRARRILTWPDPPPTPVLLTLGETVTAIARLGGHLGRKNDGPLEMKVLWRGFRRVLDAAIAYEAVTREDVWMA